MKTKQGLDICVRCSKRQKGAEATPIELHVRKHQKKNPREVVTDKAVNEDQMHEQQILEVDNSQIHVEAGDYEENDNRDEEQPHASEKEKTGEEEETDEDVASEAVEKPLEKEATTEEYVASEAVEKPPEKEATTEENVSREEEQPQQSVTKEKRKRGPTKMRKLAKDAMKKINVEFSVIGEHSGPGSVTLSSFLGTLVRTHVPVLVDDWRNVDGATKDTMWDLIQARFNLDEATHRGPIFKQMGTIWRSSKSRLVNDLRKTKSATQRLMLKPSNIQSLASWNNWVKSRTSPTFKIKSDKYRDLRKSQIPHTTSRKGMYRLSVEMKKKSDDPKKVTRSKVWLAGHTHADGRPVKKEFAETIERIQSIDSQMDSTSTENIREDAVSQVLGKDKNGRVRGMGRGVSLTKLAYLNARDLHVQKLEASQAVMMNKIEEMQNKLDAVMANKSSCADVDAQSDVSNKVAVKCKLLDWYSLEDVVVGVGEFCSAEPNYAIDQIPIGPNAAAILLKSAIKPDASLWRPTITVKRISEVIGKKIPWPFDRIILESPDNNSSDANPAETTASYDSQPKCNLYAWNGSGIVAEGIICSLDPNAKVNQISLGPNAAMMKVEKVIDHEAFLFRPSPDMSVMGDALNMTIAWPLDKIGFISPVVDSPKTSPGKAAKTTPMESRKTSPGCQSTSRSTCSSKSTNKKCILYDCWGSGKIVAEGRVFSSDPAAVVHFVPLGPNASKVLIDLAKNPAAKLWRPTSELQCLDDAKGTWIAWPNDKLKIV